MAGKPRSLNNMEIMDIIDNDSGGKDDTEEMTGSSNKLDDSGDEEELEEGEHDASVNVTEEDEVDEEQNVLPDKRKRLKMKDRNVHSLETALDETNYDSYDALDEKKEIKVITQKKTKNDFEESVSWVNQQPALSRAGRTPRVQIRRVQSGVVPEAENATTPRDSFSIFLIDPILEQLVRLTNRSIDLKFASLPESVQGSKLGYGGHTNLVEMKAFHGLNYLRGLLLQNMWHHERLFDPEIGHPVFTATMSRNRFKFLFRVLRFDNPETWPERFRKDKFAAMRSFFECWNSRCTKTVNPGDFVTIDECLYGCRNQLGFKTYNPNKASKYGINLKCLNKVAFPYTYHSEVFAGRPELEAEAEYYIPTTQGVTLRLVVWSVGCFVCRSVCWLLGQVLSWVVGQSVSFAPHEVSLHQDF